MFYVNRTLSTFATSKSRTARARCFYETLRAAVFMNVCPRTKFRLVLESAAERLSGAGCVHASASLRGQKYICPNQSRLVFGGEAALINNGR